MTLLVLLGLVLLAAGAIGLKRAARRGRSRVAACLTAGIGLATTALGAYVIYLHPQPFFNLFARDFKNPQLMEELQTADLRGPSAAGTPGDWPQWRGVNRDGKSSETGLLEQWPAAGPPILWKVPIKGGYASVAVVQGRLFTMDRDHHRERVLCFDANDGGKLLWQYAYPADYQAVSYPAGPRATPTVHQGLVYTLGATGMFHCLEAEAKDGKPVVRWSKDLNAEFAAKTPDWGHACSPLVEGDLVIVQPGGARGSVAALHRITGRTVWTALSDESGYCSPVAMTVGNLRVVVTMTGSNIVGLRATDGQVLFTIGWEPSYKANIATPIVAGSYVFLSSAYGHGCTLLKLTPSGGGGVNAEQVYREKFMMNHHATCVLVGDYLYGFHENAGVLTCVNLRTTQEAWRSRAADKGTLIYADGRLIILTERGQLVLLEATPTSGTEVRGRLHLFDAADTWALPVLADGRLYVRGSSELVCLDLRKQSDSGMGGRLPPINGTP